MGGNHPRDRSCTRRVGIRGARKADFRCAAVHVSKRRPRPVRRHRDVRGDGRPSGERNARSDTREPAMNLFGKLTWSAIPFDQPIIMGAMAFMVLLIVGVLGFATYKRAWPYLWTEWLTSVDHKRIGIMYVILGLV